MDSNITLELSPGSGNARNSEGSFVTLDDGRILFAYTRYISDDNDDAAPSEIVTRISSDGGCTWSRDDRLLIPRGDAENIMSVSLLRLGLGQGLGQASRRIALLVSQKRHLGAGMSCTPLLHFSEDEMETLSPPSEVIPRQEYHVVNNDRMIQLASGRLVIPVSQHRVGIQRFSNPGLIFFLLSDDEGQTWQESRSSFYRCFPDGHGWQEPGAIQLKDGRLWAWMRTGWSGNERCGRQWQTFSSDEGLTWSEPEESSFVSPYSPLSIKRNPLTGDLLAVWNDHSGRFPTPSYDIPDHPGARWGIHRTPLVCAFSHDDGETWTRHTLLEGSPNHGFCYTAIHFVEDAVLLAYCAGPTATSQVLDHLRIRRLSL